MVLKENVKPRPPFVISISAPVTVTNKTIETALLVTDKTNKVLST